MWLVQLAASLPGGWEGRWIIALGSAGSSSSKPPTPDGVVQLRERWEGSGSPGGLAKPQVCYETLPVVETFLRIGIGCPACSPGASCLPTLPASLSSFPDSLLCLCLSLQTCLSHLNR